MPRRFNPEGENFHQSESPLEEKQLDDIFNERFTRLKQESDLEGNLESTRDDAIDISKGLSKKPKSRFGKFYRIMAALTIVGVEATAGINAWRNVSGYKKEMDANIELWKTGHRSTQMIEHESDGDQSKDEMLERIFSFDMQKIAKENGYEANLAVDGGLGRAVVYVEQTHDRSEAEDKSKIIESQKNIEGLFLDIQSVTDNELDTAFIEGISNGDSVVENIKDQIDDIRGISPNPGSYKQLLGMYDKSEGMRILTSGWANTWFDYTCSSKFQELESLTDNSVKDSDEYKKLKELFGDDSFEDDVYRLGAVKKLFADGVLNIEGVETDETHIARTEAIEDFVKAGEGLSKADVFLHGKRLAKDLAEKRKLFIDANEEAEDVALEILTQSVQKISPLVFGRAHSFIDNIERYNEEHPDDQINLIELRRLGS